MNKFKTALVAVAFAVTALAPVPATAAPLVVPTGNWPVCNEVRVTYCVESVSIQGIGSIAETMVWSATGTAAAATYPEGAIETKAGPALPGMWSTATWSDYGHADYGYDGVFVQVKTANQFTNHLSFEVVPVKVEGGATMRANQLSGISAPEKPTEPVPLPIEDENGELPEEIVEGEEFAEPVANAKYQASLNPNDTIIATVRIGEIIPGISLGIGRVVDINTTTASGKITYTATPVFTAEASSTRDCNSAEGIAVANSYQIMAFTIVENDDQGFGVDGLSGKMSVTSNASCEFSTPSWDPSTGSLSWVAAAPHYAADGVTLNRGFYRAIIPAEDALLLWGLANPADARLALTVSVTNDGTDKQTAIKNISFRRGAIRIEFTNFTFSKNTFVIKKKAGYSKFVAKRNLVCKKEASNKKPGKQVIRVKNGYACPSGYKR